MRTAHWACGVTAVLVALATSEPAKSTAVFSASVTATVSVLTRNPFFELSLDNVYVDENQYDNRYAEPPNEAFAAHDLDLTIDLEEQTLSTFAIVSGSANAPVPSSFAPSSQAQASRIQEVFFNYLPDDPSLVDPLTVDLLLSYSWSIAAAVDGSGETATALSRLSVTSFGAQHLGLGESSNAPPNFSAGSGGTITLPFSVQVPIGEGSQHIVVVIDAFGSADAKPPVAVAEPASIALLGFGAAALGVVCWVRATRQVRHRALQLSRVIPGRSRKAVDLPTAAA